MIEDSKGKASTSKGLKRKKTVQGYKGKSKKARTCALRELATFTTKRDIKRMNVAAVSKRIRRTIHKQT